MTDLLREKLPPIFRVTAITHQQISEKETRYNATLFHEQASLHVFWTVRQPDLRICPGVLVRISWAGHPQSQEGAVRIVRLILVEIPVSYLNLFDTVPGIWVKDRTLIQRASALMDWLPLDLRHLFNGIFWEGRRFHRFIVGPCSLNGHHNLTNGNFMHTVDVAERCLDLASREPLACRSVLVMASLLHDAGKADEYQFNYQRQCFEMSARGALVGHRHTILEWIAAALARLRIHLPEKHHLALLHCLTAAKGAKYLGIRAPVSQEANILSVADRLSGEADLVLRHRPKGDGFGGYHKHLDGRPYVVGQWGEVPALMAPASYEVATMIA